MHPDYPETYRYDPRSIRFNISAMRAYRTTREAYGYSLYFEKRNLDWLWIVGAIVVIVAVVVVWRLSKG